MERFLILARNPSKATAGLRSAFAPLGRVDIVTDRPEAFPAAPSLPASIAPPVIHIPNEEADGFAGMMSISGSFPRITAWSRAFAYLSERPVEDDAVWFVEEDVAGDADSFFRFVKATIAHRPDLAAINIRSRTEDPGWLWWRYADGFFADPAAAFQPLCRISGHMVKAVLDLQKVHGQLTFHEVLFASLAKQREMRCLSWDRSAEFRYLLRSFRYRPAVIDCAHGISHPVKNLAVHEAICGLSPAELPRKRSASLGSWAILPDDYDFLARFCRRNGVGRVAEFGPGDSTLALLDAGCRVISFEHDPAWMNHAQRRFDGEGSVQLEYCEEGCAPSLETLRFQPELVFVDGPPAREGQERPRLNPCDWGLEVCGLIILHDTRRAGEQATLACLEERQMTVIRIPTQKGLAVVIDPRRRPECLDWDFSGA